MPHITVKMYKGRTEEQKQNLTQELNAAIIRSIGCAPDHVSIDIVDYDPAEWKETVYDPEIKANWDRLYIKPKY